MWVLAAVGLSSAWMLAWGAAALIPLVLHFLNRRRGPSIQWAAMQLLLQVIEQQAKRTRFEQLLLLAVRVLILLVLAWALARPFWSESQVTASAAGGRVSQLWVIAIDTSYSMGYLSNGASRLDAAKSRAAQLIAAAEQGDAFAIVALSKPSKAIVGTPTFDRAGCLSEVQQISLQDTGSELISCLAIIDEITRSSVEIEGMPEVAHIVLLSDLGQDCWQTAVDGPDREVLEQLQKKHLVEIESFNDQDPTNVAILAVRPSTSRAVAGDDLLVEIDVASSGVQAEHLPVQLEMDGNTIASTYVDIPAGESRSIRLQVTPSASGLSLLTASLPDDQLIADNRRMHVIEVRQQVRILIVEQERNDSRLVRLALQAAKRSSMTQVVASVSKLELDTTDLNLWDVIILNDIPSLNSQTLDKLQRYAREAGSLMFLFGSRTLSDNWNTYLEDNHSLLGFRFAEPSDQAEWSIDPLDYRSPVVAPFAGFPNSGLLTTPIFKFWQIDGWGDQSLVIDLATTDGRPLIVRQRVGTGWVASLLSAPQDGLNLQAGQTWNAMATWPSFLPLMQQLLQIVLDTQNERYNVLAGDRLLGTIPEAGEWSTVTIQRPDGSESQLAAETLGNRAMLSWTYDQTENRGIYRARWSSGEQVYVVNINPIESSLQSIQLDQLPVARPEASILDKTRATTAAFQNDDSLSRILLGILIALLVAESVLAWSLGRRIG